MSIQSSINSALSNVESIMLHKYAAGNAEKPAKPAKPTTVSDAPESPTTQNQAPETESTAPTPQAQPSQAEAATPGDIMISGNSVAAEIARGRVAAKTQQIAATRLSRVERMDRLKAKREEMQKLKREISGLETAFKKEKKGGGKYARTETT